MINISGDVARRLLELSDAIGVSPSDYVNMLLSSSQRPRRIDLMPLRFKARVAEVVAEAASRPSVGPWLFGVVVRIVLWFFILLGMWLVGWVSRLTLSSLIISCILMRLLNSLIRWLGSGALGFSSRVMIGLGL